MKLDGTSVELSVLFIDDEPLLRLSATLSLGRKFSTVYTAEHGKEGLELFKLHRPDIVITDINMPEMDGMELAREIRKLDSRTPILFISANQYDELTDRLNSMASASFIQKPFTTADLFHSIKILTCERICQRQ